MIYTLYETTYFLTTLGVVTININMIPTGSKKRKDKKYRAITQIQNAFQGLLMRS